MPHYRFTFQDGRSGSDESEIDLPGLHAARAQAIQACGEMLRDAGASFPFGDEWQMLVKDEAGRTVLTVRISAIAD